MADGDLFIHVEVEVDATVQVGNSPTVGAAATRPSSGSAQPRPKGTATT